MKNKKNKSSRREVQHRAKYGMHNVTALLKSNVPVGQFGLGALVGTGAGFGAQWLWNKYGLGAKTWMPGFVGRFLPLVASGVAGAGLYYAQRKKSKTRAVAHLAGALTGGVVVTVFTEVRTRFPELSALNPNALASYGLVVDQTGQVRPLSAYSAVNTTPQLSPGMMQATRLAMAGADDGYNPYAYQ